VLLVAENGNPTEKGAEILKSLKIDPNDLIERYVGVDFKFQG